MSRRWFSLLLCLAVCLNSVPLSAAAQPPLLRLNEADTKIDFHSGGTSITLALANDARRNIPARIRLEILDPQDRVRAAATRDEIIRPGTSKLAVTLSPSLTASLTNDQRRRLMLSRLRYRITPGAREGTSPALSVQGALPATIEGYISLSQMIAPDVFELRVAAPQFARGGTDYRARVRATHPLTVRPVAGVSVAAEIKFESGERDVALKASGSTDAEGFAVLDFELPRRIAGNEGQIKVTAQHGDFRQEAQADIQLNNFANILVTTDKMLYQPGQELHIRALVFDAMRRALANAPATLKITDPEGIAVFRALLQTSRFGVASADWPIPEGTRLGDYNLSIELDGEEYENSPQGYAAIRVSRYELPNFVVTAKTDRAFYLPGQNAEVEVRADYLFGQPVARGRVRVVREKERTWNYREQKWDIDEGAQQQGETDKNGRFTARLDFKAEFDDLLDDTDNEYAPRFRDLTYAAYFTDPTTNRTEQRRFDVRLTKEAIHVYVITGDQRQSAKLPLQFYVSTSYADGAPAADCEVQIRDEDEAASDDETPGRLSAPAVHTLKTNKYGVAKVAGLRLQEQADEDDADLHLTARDGKGAVGHRSEDFDFWDHAIIRVETDKPLYRPGDPVRVRIAASAAQMKVAIDVAREGRVIRSEMIELQDGQASLVIPYTDDLKDEVAVSAYSLSEENFNRYDYPSAGRTILFPRDRDLKLDVELSRATYRPGEEARADFRVRTPDGRLIESALGVVVFDKAVEERARTDSDFSGGAGFSSLYRAWRGYGDAVAGVSRGELAKVDLKQPLPAGFGLVAEILLRESNYTPQLFGGDGFETDLRSVFHSLLTTQLNPLQSLLETSYAQQQIYPTNADMLHRLLFPAGFNFSELRDPWGTPYRASFFVERETDVTAFISAGADKRFDTADDFIVARFARPYFRPLGEAINRTVARFNARTGRFIRDAATLKTELAREGIDLDAARDPWGQPFQLGFGVNTTNYLINVHSSGPDRKFGDAAMRDDVFVWRSSIDYTRLLKAEIDDALGKRFAATNNFPQTAAEFDDALARAGLNKETLLRDGWDRPLYVTFRRDARYTDRVQIRSYASYGQPQQEKTEVTPITQHVNYLDLRSAGADGKEGTADDFDIATFSRIVAEQTSKEKEATLTIGQPISFSGMTGAIIGIVTDSQGAVIAGATVEAKSNVTAQTHKATSDDDGKFYLRNLPIGMYRVTVSAAHFKNTIITDVPVRAGQITQLDLALDVGGVSETVTVMSSAAEANSTTVSQSQITNLPLNSRNSQNFLLLEPGVGGGAKSGQTSTPRLREYFPETLVWQPSVETDRQGRAQIRFKLADNITTWKMSVIGSTADGEIGVAEREIQAFQPFFVEHDPPRVLTEGDEIALPVVVRNYLAAPQQVALDLKPEDWFTMLGPTHKQTRVPAGDAVRETFDFRAVASIKEGKQRITAIAGDADDAIERGVHVHPDGAEIAHTAAGIFGDAATLAIDIPADALPNTARAELKIYPNVLAHIVESVEAIMSRPYGCGEQTISSAYPSLLVLRQYRRASFAPDKLPPVALKAQRYLRLGYERLLSYRAADGGFSYWGRGESADLALTAYAIRFLADAAELIDVDEDALTQARAWLVKQQQPDGSWKADEWDQRQALKPRTAMLTAYIARVLAKQTEQPSATASPIAQPNKQQTDAATPSPLRRALHYLSRRVEQIDEPYLLASYALAAQDAGDTSASITKTLDRLRALARDDGSGGAYWSLETNTPFYGWGRAGRIETTALALQALARVSGVGCRVSGEGQPSMPTDARHLTPDTRHPLVERGLLFLLRNKDQYGVWLSTQATINVLDALVLLSNGHAAAQQQSGVTEEAEVFVNDRRAGTVKLPLDDQFNNPVTLDLSRFLSAGANRVEIERAPGSPKAAAQVVGAYYLPWSKAQADGRHHVAPEAASALRLAVKFDQTTAAVGDEITCSVEAERIGFHGYGMLLGEIGLPPGADVDRASLEEAVKASGWTFTRYDVLPDRIVVYLWPRAGGTKFTFKFRSRFGLNAQTAASMLYDYYNPEARAILAPTRFVVSEKTQATSGER